MTALRVHTLATEDKYGDSLKATDIKFAGRTFGVGAVPTGKESRQEFCGPMVPGPWAYAFAHAACISLHYIEPDPVVEVEEGDLLVIDDSIYRVIDQRGGWLVNDDWVKLELVVTP